MKYLAAPGLRIPVPGRAGQLVPDAGDGIGIDPTDPYFARLVADGDLVPVTSESPAAPDAGEGDQ